MSVHRHPYFQSDKDLDDAKAFTAGVIAILKDGGSWAVPYCASVYTFYKSAKEFSVQGAGGERIDYVLNQLGYTRRVTHALN